MAIPDYKSNPRLTLAAAVVLGIVAVACVILRALFPDWEPWFRKL